MKKFLIVLSSILFFEHAFSLLYAQNVQNVEIVLAKPSEKQLRFADWEVGAFICFDLITFSGEEHGDGQAKPELFNPTDIDVEQWVRTAKDMGARYACLTARHEGGFCLWPSKTTDYTIASSPYKDGKGDIVREFVDACRKYDVVPALYHTGGFDANATLGSNYDGQYELPLDWMTTWGAAMAEAHQKDPTLKSKLVKKQAEQMRELLTNYGPIGFMWSDHWDATDPDGVWRAVTEVAREVQPDMVFMGPDTWVPGNETGHVVYPMWNGVNTADGTNNSRGVGTKGANNYGLKETDILSGHPLGKFWRVRECTTNSGFSYGGWFWHPDHIQKTYPKELWEHVDLYYRTVGLGANTIINLPPDTRGRIPEDIAAAAKKFGDFIRDQFSDPIAERNEVVVGDTVMLSWKRPKEINTIVTMENIANGQKIAKYNLQAWVDGKWVDLENRNKVMAAAPYNSTPGYETVGHKKIDVVAPVKTNKVRFICREAIMKPVEIRSMAVYDCEVAERTYRSEFPYLSGVTNIASEAHGGVKYDVNYHGYDVSIRDKSFDHSVMVCPVGSKREGFVEYDLTTLKSSVKGLTAEIGIDDATKGYGSSEFIVNVYVDGVWQEIYKSKVLTGKSQIEKIDVKFPKNSTKLKLITTIGGDNGSSDHAVWGNLMFTK